MIRYALSTIILDPIATGTEPQVTTAPFQAPLPLNTPHEHGFYDAFARFAALVEAPAPVFSHQPTGSWRSGYVRCQVLHGFTAFEGRRFASMGGREASGEVSRWLKGCYFDGHARASHCRMLNP